MKTDIAAALRRLIAVFLAREPAHNAPLYDREGHHDFSGLKCREKFRRHDDG